ncbi:MAG: DUF4421 family protein, partial [Candidatus Latescibacteria bacterium]|nr:DUF4421 family protein [Candidatus Latescibacterota bacterium]
ERGKKGNIGIFSTSILPSISVSTEDDVYSYQSASTNSLGLYFSYDWISIDFNVLSLYLKDYKDAKSVYSTSGLTMTNNRIYNRLSMTAFDGTYFDNEKEPEDNIYFPEMKTLNVSNTFLFFFNDKMSLKNIYLGTEMPKKSAGSFYAGLCTDYQSITNNSDILIEEVSPDFKENNTQLSLEKVSYAAVSPVLGGMYNYTFNESINLTAGIGLGPTYVHRLSVKGTGSGYDSTIYYIGKVLITLGLGYTAENVNLSVMTDLAITPGAMISEKYEISVFDFNYKTRAAYRF